MTVDKTLKYSPYRGIFTDKYILSLLFSIPYIYEISKTHFYWQFCHPTFSFVVGILFCSHYLLFFEWVGGIYFLSYRFGLSVFFPGICRNMDLASYWRFWWVGLSYFLSEGESLRILSPFRGTIASLNTLNLPILTK